MSHDESPSVAALQRRERSRILHTYLGSYCPLLLAVSISVLCIVMYIISCPGWLGCEDGIQKVEKLTIYWGIGEDIEGEELTIY